MTPWIFYVACADREEALRIGRICVEERLAACANVSGPVTSVFRWDGQMQQTQEVVLILKTGSAARAALTARIRQLHAYDVPGIAAWPLQDGHAAFLQWIETETDSG